MLDWITNTIISLGYWRIAMLMLLENIFLTLPSKVIMPLAGSTISESKRF
jgi:membrane protein DedA with SNARE-associated domain